MIRNFLENLLEFYSEGISVISESLAQIAHVTCIMAILLFTATMVPKHDFIVWLIIFLVYFVNLGINGIIKFNSDDMVYVFNRKNPDDIDRHEETVKIEKKAMETYIVINVSLFGIGAVLTNIYEALIIVGTTIAVSWLFFKMSEVIISRIVRFGGQKTLLQELRDMNPEIYEGVFLFLLNIIWIFPTCILGIDVIFKILIVVVYLFCIPIISALADEGIDVTWLLGS